MWIHSFINYLLLLLRAFSLFANEGYSHHEIAEKLNISIGTSKWHISQARELLQHKIKMNHE
ncbi:MAG: winged helix-turn-helix transcriptional regulator [Saprospiraceae bacterium]|nr:winged helix-turn-helix transcriptional regulator [Candidatus Defluviibacterium haderslevense]